MKLMRTYLRLSDAYEASKELDLALSSKKTTKAEEDSLREELQKPIKAECWDWAGDCWSF
jgi:hypothetical protein